MYVTMRRFFRKTLSKARHTRPWFNRDVNCRKHADRLLSLQRTPSDNKPSEAATARTASVGRHVDTTEPSVARLLPAVGKPYNHVACRGCGD